MRNVIPRSDLPRFKAWLRERGAEVLTPTNQYEILRFRAKGETAVLYEKANGRQTPVGPVMGAVRAFRSGDGSWKGTNPKSRPRTVTPIYKALAKRDGLGCFYCGTDLVLGETATLEHIVPISHGGPNHVSNLALACDPCNQEAGHLSAVEKVRMRDAARSREGR